MYFSCWGQGCGDKGIVTGMGTMMGVQGCGDKDVGKRAWIQGHGEKGMGTDPLAKANRK
jgi:hypothetical protein